MSSGTVFDLLRSCQKGEAGSVVGRDLDTPPRLDDLYVSTKEDNELQQLFVSEYERDGKLIILTGSAGDGKSALLAKAYRKASRDSTTELGKDQFHLDATGSGYLQRSYKYDLTEFLDKTVSEMGIDAPRKGLAINYGLAIDYFKQGNKKNRDGYGQIWKALEQAETKRRVEESDVTIINLGHRDLFDINPDTFGDGVLRDIIDRFNVGNDDSPLRDRVDPEITDCPATGRCPLHYNLDQLTDDDVRDKLTKLIASSCIIGERYINPRSILDQISKILIHPSLRGLRSAEGICAIGQAIVEGDLTPSGDHLLYNRAMQVLAGGQNGEFLDPVAQATAEIDDRTLEWEANEDSLSQITHLTPIMDDEWEKTDQIRTAIRYQYFHDELGSTHADSDLFKTFLAGLAYFNGATKYERGGESVIETTVGALQNWTGQSKEDDRMAFVDGLRTTEYRFTSRWKKPKIDTKTSKQRTQAQIRPGQLRLYFEHPEGGDPVFVPLGYRLFHLMKRVKQGYSPSSSDVERSQGVRLLYSQLSQFTDKRKNIRIEDKTGKELFNVTISALGSIKVESGGSNV